MIALLSDDPMQSRWMEQVKTMKAVNIKGRSANVTPHVEAYIGG